MATPYSKTLKGGEKMQKSNRTNIEVNKDANWNSDDLQKQLLSLLKVGTDYGTISNYSKPVLFKAGAEKICRYLQLTVTYSVDHRYEDWKDGLFHYEVRVRLIKLGSTAIAAEGIGSSNTRESYYASLSPYSFANTVLKMAKKRALIDAVLNVSATSGIFTQDIEELPAKKVAQAKDEPITKWQLLKIHSLAKELGINAGTAKNLMKLLFHVDHSTKLTKQQASRFIQDLLLLSKN